MEVNNLENDSFVEEVHRDCTVIVYRNIVTGQEQICWFDNTEKPIEYEEIRDDEE